MSDDKELLIKIKESVVVFVNMNDSYDGKTDRENTNWNYCTECDASDFERQKPGCLRVKIFDDAYDLIEILAEGIAQYGDSVAPDAGKEWRADVEANRIPESDDGYRSPLLHAGRR